MTTLHATTVLYFYISCEYKSGSVNVMENKCGEFFEKNAVNFAWNFCEKKCELFFSPHSPHFLEQVTQKPRPG